MRNCQESFLDIIRRFFFFLILRQRNRVTKQTHHLEPKWLNIGCLWYTSVKVWEAMRAIDLVSLRTGVGVAFIVRLRWCWCWRFLMSWNRVVSFHLDRWLLPHICSIPLSSVKTINLWNPNSVALMMDSQIAKSLVQLWFCSQQKWPGHL